MVKVKGEWREERNLSREREGLKSDDASMSGGENGGDEPSVSVEWHFFVD